MTYGIRWFGPILGAAAVGAMKIATYETDITDAQWSYLQPMLPKPKKLGRKPTDRRVVVNAILYVLKGGIAWRLLPKNFPPCKTVYHVFRAWSLDGTWAALNDALRVCLRLVEGRKAQPSAAILDSQSTRISPQSRHASPLVFSAR